MYSGLVHIYNIHRLANFIFVGMYSIGFDCFEKIVDLESKLNKDQYMDEVLHGINDFCLDKVGAIMPHGSITLGNPT
eukprot:snap_masked-scaffold_42-processed-gene-0.5-mRNA-1 protein AED:1.00 eAED:1.00 QI:0/-1/0/0/-1/1/1/0/76